VDIIWKKKGKRRMEVMEIKRFLIRTRREWKFIARWREKERLVEQRKEREREREREWGTNRGKQ
jgi:hypothetical protein